ncbi:FH2 domain-containing protein 1 isoform X2 [Syngnathus scovelli]|uniref:FH2 domain-containing protein 1 isoform X2 n=1 Tax=Syngnathus scovelli TaxID=161590 RepID=UPI00210F27B3|nr:FH2 domain-containing protein 1 isoform X2 [Syngnathus scovelli]
MHNTLQEYRLKAAMEGNWQGNSSHRKKSGTSSFLGVMEPAQISVQPAPRPPPPPPPPPLPLPPSSSQRRSMKKLNWDTIPRQRVLGKVNVWTSALPPRDLVLDTHSMDELFGHVDRRAQARACLRGPRGHDNRDVCMPQAQVSILDAKRSMNIGIFLRYFKRPVADLLEDIVRGEWRDCGKLKELCRLLPEEGEVKQLLSYSGNPALLSEADRFMVELVKVPHYEELLKTMVLRREFSPLMEEVNKSLAVMIQAADELLDCDELHAVIRLVLKAGNYMNAGGFGAEAIGFRMTSLLKLADTKANKPGVNLLHYVAKQAEDIDSNLLTFSSQLTHLEMAARVCKEDVLADLEREVQKLKEVKLYASRHIQLHQQMAPFFTQCDNELRHVNSSLHELDVLSFAVAEFFCEDPQNFKLEECCAIFHNFCRRFVTAVQENREREAAEQRRKSRQSFRVSAKRAPAPPLALESSLESALHSLLSAGRCQRNSRSPTPPEPPTGDQQTALESPEKKQAKVEGDGEENPSTPRTPRPRTRDVFFANNGDVGSPWTILSPLTCSRQRRPRRRVTADAEEPDDAFWGSAATGPRGRSVSVDSTRHPPTLPTAAAAFRMGTLFQRAAAHRSYSSGSGAACVGNPAAGSFSFISFFRRFGGKKETEEPSPRGTDTLLQ